MISPVDSQQTRSLADALSAWLPCPYPYPALLAWVDAHLASWGSSGTMISEETAQSMLREQYREWVEVFNEYQL